MRLLTIGAKSTINLALARQPDCELLALSETDLTGEGDLTSLPYRRGSKLSLSSIGQVRRAISQQRPDLIHAFYPRPLAHTVLASLTLMSRVPLVSYRGVTSVPRRWSPDEWVAYLSPLVVGHACESAAVAEAMVTAGVPAERCHVVHNCLTRPLDLRSREEARRELGLPADATVAMMVANMRWVKGADLLMQAAMECSDLAHLHFVFMGRVMDEEVNRLAKDQRLGERVHLVGFRPQASQWLSAADLFVMPSRAEALSVALLEAMSAGICPLVSDAGGMKEAVRHEVDGVVFERQNVPALVASLRDLAASPDTIARYAASARERAESYFSADALAGRLMGMYQQVLDGRGR